jgi:lipopolysaccharide export system permease protein
LLTFVSLIRRNELVALQGLGLSVFAQIRALAPIILFISIGSVFFIDRTLPASVQALNAWGIGEYKDGNVTSDQPLWVNDNGLFVRMKGRIGLNTLTDLTFFHRDNAGYLQRVTWAEQAKHVGDSWELSNTETLIVDNAKLPPPPIAKWTTNQTPLLIDKLAAEPRDLGLADLSAFASFRGSGSRPSASYKVWHLKRLSLPFAAIAMLLLAAPIMQRLGRRDTGTVELVIGVGISFIFMIVDGILVTMGSNGALIPGIAAFGAPATLAGIGLYLWLRQEILA